MQDDTWRGLSQSEGGDWQQCDFKAAARWIYEYRDGAAETWQQRIGSMGHAVLHDRAVCAFTGREVDMWRAIKAEATKRGWSQTEELSPDEWDLGSEAEQAIDAANNAACEVGLDSMALAPDLFTGTGGPLAETTLRAPWGYLVQLMTVGGLRIDPSRLSAVFHRFTGIEGRPDLVAWPEGPGGPLAIIDWKFRQHMPSTTDADFPSQVPDRQFAWYSTLLRALGMRPAGGIELWQVNAYAGRWLDVEDFLRVAEGGAVSVEEQALVVDAGLPTRDAKRYGAVGKAVAAEVWAEAHRLLANRRLERRLDAWRAESRASAKGKGKPPPDLLSYAEQEGAARFLADLRAQRPVVVVKMRADPQVCLEVVRDVVVAVDAGYRQHDAGLPPPRHLQTWRGSACQRPGGCPVQSPCLSSLGTDRGEQAIRHAAESNRMARESAEECV